jgi:hypothetical protein
VAGRFVARPDLVLNRRVLQHAERADACRKRDNLGLGVRNPPHVLGDFFSLDSCTNTISLLSAAISLPSLMILLLVRGSAQNPRMNPCPSARPGEGEREENRKGTAQSGSESASEDWGDRFCSCWGARAESSHPRQHKQCAPQRRRNRARADQGRLSPVTGPPLGCETAAIATNGECPDGGQRKGQA